MSDLTLRFAPYTSLDHSTLFQLAGQIWHATYSEILSPDQMKYMLDMMYNSNTIEQQISQGHIWELVYDNTKLIGFLHYHLDEDAVKLSKIYLDVDVWSKKISPILIARVEKYATQNNKARIWLTVNKNNIRAQKFYDKMGFQVIADEVFDIGRGYVMDDFIYEKKIL